MQEHYKQGQKEKRERREKRKKIIAGSRRKGKIDKGGVVDITQRKIKKKRIK